MEMEVARLDVTSFTMCCGVNTEYEKKKNHINKYCIRRKEVVHGMCVQCTHFVPSTYACCLLSNVKNESHTSLLTVVVDVAAATTATDIHSCRLVGTVFFPFCLRLFLQREA